MNDIENIKRTIIERIKNARDDSNVAEALLNTNKYTKYYKAFKEKAKRSDDLKNAMIELIESCEDIDDLLSLIAVFIEVFTILYCHEHYILIPKHFIPDFAGGDYVSG